MPVEGKVARIISSYEVAFNVGSNSGVHQGDKATVHENVEILDPDSGDLLGYFRRPVMRFEITTVGDRLSVGKSDEIVRVSGPMDIFAGQQAGPSRVRRKVTETRSNADSTTVFIPIGAIATIEKAPSSPDEGAF